MTDDALAFRPVRQCAAAIRRGDLSPVALTEAYLARIGRLNGHAKTYVTVLEDAARSAAREAGRELAAGRDRGSLHGIPYAVKDLVHVKDVPTTGGSRVLEDHRATENAHLIDRMEAAGAVLLGKANLHEFAWGATGENPLYGTVPNPYDAARVAGGSSSGSAGAVAYGLAAAAFGTDTGGSVRVPAALSGLVGLKPTLGLIGTRGVIPVSWSLDHLGVIARTVDDAGLLLQAAAGHDPADPLSADAPAPSFDATPASTPDRTLEGLRIGIPRDFYFDDLDQEIAAAVTACLARLEGLGVRILKVDLPDLAEARTVSLTVQVPEALSYHSTHLAERAALYGGDVRSGLAQGQFILAEQYIRAKRMMETYRQAMARVFEGVEAIVTPTCPIVAPKIGTVTVATGEREEAVGNALTRLTTFFNLTGNPALSVPCGVNEAGLPMGLQIVGRPFDEATVLDLGRAVETMPECRVPPPQLEDLQP